MGGTPFTLRCPKCKKGENWREPRESHKGIVATGLKRFHVRRPGVGQGEQAEVKHAVNGCGYTWWTFHPNFTDNRPVRLGPGA